ncbi:MBL fold metallo-hydrolase [Paenibacillus sp. sgz500958]|uniref:MBL fold metallo-hydrolase n=1 Tax=Paenibacillus sp. sgz500958 TaxID=3242475 RepID=UPI0036D2FAD8
MRGFHRESEQHQSLRRAEITKWEGNLIRVSVPMQPPLRRVNSYILPDQNGRLSIVDPGPRSLESELAWEGALEELGYSWSSISGIVVTHHHPDHYGLAGWMQSKTGCRVWMSERAYAETQLMWGEAGGMNKALPDFFVQHGLPDSLVPEMKEHMDSFLTQVSPHAEVSYVNTSAPFIMGGRDWIPVETGGHAPGHLSFYQRDSGQILCGDAVLPIISPNVSLLPGSDPQPLLTFIESLHKLSEYKTRMAFAGHLDPFEGFNSRIHELLRHHEERLEEAESLLLLGPLNGYGLCSQLFRSRVTSLHQLRFALSETLAHLKELVRRGRAVEYDEDGKIWYRLI